MPKPVCVKCQRFYRCKKNGFMWTEMKPNGKVFPALAGTEAPEAWEPYKVWRSDLYSCLGCGHEIIVGHAECPSSRDYHEDFTDALAESKAQVNDC